MPDDESADDESADDESADDESADDETTVDDSEVSTERFYLGTIQKLFRGSQSGVVRSDSGREIPFVWLHVVTSGAMQRFDELREGMRVGFDVGWTSRGLRVTMLQVRR